MGKLSRTASDRVAARVGMAAWHRLCCAHTQRAPILQPGDGRGGHTSDLTGQDEGGPHVSFEHLLLRVLDVRGL